jgi:hypothetical protein
LRQENIENQLKEHRGLEPQTNNNNKKSQMHKSQHRNMNQQATGLPQKLLPHLNNSKKEEISNIKFQK